ncbi:hypothetical protein, partial [Nostoc sp. NMS9]|uniref:hypothetical protein n=1 Tax=Nostoc sp. NMS9 TaxID=2815393 RepID=UPI0025CC59FE
PLPLCPWSGLNDKSLTGHDMTRASYPPEIIVESNLDCILTPLRFGYTRKFLVVVLAQVD